MPDRKKVMSWLEGLAQQDWRMFHSDSEVQVIAESALALLKEQEAVEPKQVGLYGKEDWYGLVCVCPDCKAEWMSDEADTHFCPKCGQAVKWNESD